MRFRHPNIRSIPRVRHLAPERARPEVKHPRVIFIQPGVYVLKKTLLSLLACSLVGTVGLPAPAADGRANATTIPHVLRFATAEDIQGLNPDLNAQLVLSFLAEMTMGYLFRCDHENRFIPELATEIPTFANGGISRDGKTITIHVRKGVKWSDGVPFDANDVKFSISVVNNPANNVPSHDGFDQITKVDVPNPYTVVVHLKAPYGQIVPTLFSSANSVAVLPKHILGSLPDINTAPYNSLPVGIGPFRYTAWKRGDSVELEANPLYWRRRPKLDRVIMKLIPDRNTVLAQLQTGEIDLWYPFGGAFLGRVAAMPTVDVLRTAGYAFNEINLNLKNPALADVVVRRALLLADDRKTIIAKIGHGVGVPQDVSAPLVDPSVPKDIPFTAYDPAKANALLDKNGWVRGSDGVRSKNGNRLSFEVATGVGLPDVDAQIELLRSFWKDIGVELSVQHYESSMLFAPKSDGGIINSGKFDLAIIAWNVGVPIDPSNFYGCKKVPPVGQNMGSYCNPKVDALLDQLHSTYDNDQYKADLSKILHIVAADVPVIIQNGRENIFGYNKDLKNFHPNSVTVFDDMLNVDI
jgi:peptide/nickel transport system substrate-binding protein